MNQVLVDYIKRYNTKPSVKFDKFFTQLSLDEYTQKLPYLYGIQNFCLRLLQAYLNEEKICIYSDYDTDAVTATAVMYWGLIELGFLKENLDFYAPDRFVEGYGMNPAAVEELALKFDLIISVDCGINSVEEAAIVKKLQQNPSQNGFRKNETCDLIITDHHHLKADLPDCTGVLNPRLAEYYYQNPEKLVNLNLSLDSVLSDSKTILRDTQNSDLLLLKIREWLKKSSRNTSQYGTNPENFLSQSVTGVGVAWFCVVWLGYFLTEMER